MNNIEIINYWSCQNFLENNLIINLANRYSEENNLELINLNLLDKVFNTKFWFLCKKTGKLFFFNLVNNKLNL